eukprot:6522694-Prymnesium_polylepis.1
MTTTCSSPCVPCPRGLNTTAHCTKLFVDWGANIGQSLRAWYHHDQRWGPTLNKAAGKAARQSYCADVFEASPSFNSAILREAETLWPSKGGPRCDCANGAGGECRCGCAAEGKHVKLYLATPISLEGGPVSFESLGFVKDAGGTLSFDAHTEHRKPKEGKAKMLTLQSVNAVEYLRSKASVEHLVLKIDVENY